MSALHANAARSHATPKAAPPVMHRAAPPSRHAAPPIASLAAIPAGPLVQRECADCEREEEGKSEIQRRLKAAAAAPSVQRKCAACEEEDSAESSVQPRLEVGPVGDRYEQEADSIAAQVMAMRDPGGGVDASAADGAVQRACSACASASDDEPRARRFAEPEAETDQVVRARRDKGAETIAASDTQLTSGGSALPAATRGFFESRMGRDLGDVRIHQGGAAAAMNDSISARAFTYKNHVWLGSGESAAPSFTMAHELAHVMQQTAPGPVGPAPQRVQRIDCDAKDDNLFFAPVDGTTQRDGEQALISLLTKGSGVVGEAPVPNATTDKAGPHAIGAQGRADLMKTNNGRIVGLTFDKEKGGMSPRPWYSPHNSAMGTTHLIDERLIPRAVTFFQKLHVDGAEVSGKLADHTAPAGSRFDPPGMFRDAANAPSEIEIGEAKFGGTPHARTAARAQIMNYLGGIRFAHRGYENIRQNIEASDPDLAKGKKPKLPAWNLAKADLLTSIPGGPEEWAPQGESKDLVIAKWVKEWNPLKKRDDVKPKACDVPKAKGSDKRQSFKGKLFFGHDSGAQHVWLYAWHPDTKPPANSGGSAKFTGYRAKAKTLYDELMATPAADSPRKRPRAAVKTAAPAVAATPAIVRRGPKRAQKPVPAIDPFAANYNKWKLDQKALSKDYGAYGKTDDYKLDTASLLFNRTVKNTIDITGKSPNKVDVDRSKAMQDLERDWQRLDVLTGASGALLGTLRKTFGAAFIKVINIYKSLRDRFAKFWEDRKKKGFSKKGRLAAAVMKIGGMIFAAIVHHVLPRIGNLLLNCVEQGFAGTIEKLFGDEFRKQVGDKIDEVEAKLATLEAEVEKKIEDAVGNVFSGVTDEYERIMAVWDDVGELIGIAKTAFNVARVAACAATGIETVGIGCVVAGVDFILGLFDVSPSEMLAESLLGTCMAQELIGDYVLSIKEVKEFPTTAAQTIVDFVRPVLPAATLGSYTFNFSDMLCKSISGTVDLPKTSEVTCGKGGSMGGSPSGKDYRLPPEIDPKIFNRAPTDDDLKHGRLPKTGTVPKAPKQPPPTETRPPPAETPSGGSPGAGEEGTQSGKGGVHGVDLGKISGGTFVAVNYYIHGIGGGFAAKDYKGAVKTVFVTAVDSNAVYFGPDQVDIKVYEVFEDPKRKGVYRMNFEPVQDYILWFRSDESTVQLGFVVKRRKGQVGAPM